MKPWAGPAGPDFCCALASCCTCAGFGALRTVAYDGYLENLARFVQRIAAVRETPHPEAGAPHDCFAHV